jgi:hypothetical protein
VTEPGPAIVNPGPIVIAADPRPDGYRPTMEAFVRWTLFRGAPPAKERRLILSAARRLDAGHLQVERVRDGIANLPPDGSIAHREEICRIFGDAELAMVALSKALHITVGLSGRYGIRATVPEIVTRQRPLILKMRDHYEHIEERAFGKIKGAPSPDAEGAWEQVKLFTERAFTDGTDTLGIDGETTELCIVTRDYLVAAWFQVVERMGVRS